MDFLDVLPDSERGAARDLLLEQRDVLADFVISPPPIKMTDITK